MGWWFGGGGGVVWVGGGVAWGMVLRFFLGGVALGGSFWGCGLRGVVVWEGVWGVGIFFLGGGVIVGGRRKIVVWKKGVVLVGDLFWGSLAWGLGVGLVVGFDGVGVGGGGEVVKWGGGIFFFGVVEFFCGKFVGGTVLRGDIFFWWAWDFFFWGGGL